MYIDGDAIWNCIDGVGGPYVPIELTITCTTPSALDMAGRAMTTSPSLILSNGPFIISGDLQNMGSNTVTSMDINYSVDGGAAVTESVSGLSFQLVIIIVLTMEQLGLRLQELIILTFGRLISTAQQI